MRMVRMWSPIRIVAAICRSCVGAISVANWIIGTIILVFFIWTLNTSGNFHLMGKGRSIITITELIFGLLVSVQGLIGLFGACQRQEWLLKLFLFLTIMTVSIEVGTFVSLRVTEVKVADLVEQSWTEANLNTRNYIQREFQCCGLTGLSEFASKLDPIDDSCYPPRSENIVPNMGRQPFRIGCKPKMIDWINKSRNRFISLSVFLLIIQILSIIFTLILLRHEPRKEHSSLNISIDEITSHHHHHPHHQNNHHHHGNSNQYHEEMLLSQRSID